jgi:hypothetical protein
MLCKSHHQEFGTILATWCANSTNMKFMITSLALLITVAFCTPALAQDSAEQALKREIMTELAVNEAQADTLSALLLKYKEDKSEIAQEYKADPKLRGEKMKALNEQMNSKVRGMLNEQQFKKFMMLLLKQ